MSLPAVFSYITIQAGNDVQPNRSCHLWWVSRKQEFGMFFFTHAMVNTILYKKVNSTIDITIYYLLKMPIAVLTKRLDITDSKAHDQHGIRLSNPHLFQFHNRTLTNFTATTPGIRATQNGKQQCRREL